MVDYWDWTLIDNDWSTVINAKMFFMYSRMVLYTCICTLLSKSSLLEEINPFNLWRVQLGVSSRRLIKKNIGNSRLHCGHLGWALIAEVMNNKMPSNFSKLGLIGMVDGECTGKDLIGACCDELTWARRAFFRANEQLVGGVVRTSQWCYNYCWYRESLWWMGILSIIWRDILRWYSSVGWIDMGKFLV